MLAKQLVFCLVVMIKDDLFPALVVVTGLALGSEFPLVPLFLVIVLFVTGKTIHLQLVLVQVAFVTRCAFDVPVLPAQRILGFLVVIKRNLFPATLDMAGLALGAELVLMYVIFFMT
jgi:hypothetical protein